MRKIIFAVVVLSLLVVSAYAADELSIGGQLVGSYSHLSDFDGLEGDHEDEARLWAPLSWDYTELDANAMISENASITYKHIIPGNALVDVYRNPGNSINMKEFYLSLKGEMGDIEEVQAGRIIVPFALNMSPGFGFGQVFATVDNGPKGANCNQGDGVSIKGSVNDFNWMLAGTKHGFIGHDVIEGDTDSIALWARAEKDFGNVKAGLSYVTQESENALGLHFVSGMGKMELSGEFVHINRFSQDMYALKAAYPLNDDMKLWAAYYSLSDDAGTRDAIRAGADYDINKNFTLRVTAAFDDEAIFLGDGLEAAVVGKF